MPSISYLVKRIKKMNYSGLFETVDAVSHKINKPKALVFLDIMWCGFIYGAGYVDYDVIGFYKLSHKQRKTMLTRGKNDKIVKKLNDKDYWYLFNEKNEFNKKFSSFVNRDWLYFNKSTLEDDDALNKAKEEFKTFVTKHPVFFAKPNAGQCGKGIQKVDINSQGIEAGELLERLLRDGLELFEEPIVQHKKMMMLNDSSVNTIRIVTAMNKKGKVTILASFVRIGNGNIVDNFNSGGMTAKVDKDSGIIMESAINKEGHIFEKHPITNTTIQGFKIPFFEEAKNLVTASAKLSENVRYVGWDVAITKSGPILVEGNQYPGHDIYQVAEKIGKDDLGVWPEFKKAIK